MGVLRHIIQKEFAQLRRDPRMVRSIILGPIIQLLAFGYAANMDVRHVPIVVLDQDRSQASRRLVDRFLATDSFVLAGTAERPADIDPYLIKGKAQLALIIGPRYGDELASGGHPRVQVIADGSDANSSGIGLGYANRLIQAESATLSEQAIDRASGGHLARIDLVPRIWYNPDLKSRWFFVPAVLALVLMTMTMVLSSMSVVKEKEVGTMEQIMVTPIRPWQLIVGKLYPFAVIGLLDLCLVTLVGITVFRVPFRGSFPLLLLFTASFLMSMLGLGLFVSTLVRTQQQAMISSTFALQVPMLYLSGLIFPIESMPRIVQYLTLGIPVRYYATIVRGIFLKGAGPRELWQPALWMTLIGLFVLTLAAARFRKTID